MALPECVWCWDCCFLLFFLLHSLLSSFCRIRMSCTRRCWRLIITDTWKIRSGDRSQGLTYMYSVTSFYNLLLNEKNKNNYKHTQKNRFGFSVYDVLNVNYNKHTLRDSCWRYILEHTDRPSHLPHCPHIHRDTHTLIHSFTQTASIRHS